MSSNRDLSDQSRAVQHLFDRSGEQWASRYKERVEDVGQLDLVLRAELVRRMLSRTPRPATGRPRLLDIGCGTGHVLRGLADDRFDVVGMDFAEGMVKVAAGEHPTRRFLVADARSIPASAASFDAVSIVGVLEYIVEHGTVVGELARVLKPGGALVISVPNAKSLFRRLHDLERSVTAPLRALLGRAGRRYHQFRWSEGSVRRLLAERGLAVEEMAYCTYGLKTPALERVSANIAFCNWASRRYQAPSLVSRRLAWTLVVRARRLPSQ